ncbi:MAG: FimV N-terminal protein [Hydrocarboniphaga sp.]|uniref:FimV/HubP family polar landmark protein n=1 Tax=Hydrocarboniphaga sp. TaxID=2033016 RepID=UPI00261817BE|nr:FimV/HubP family polar landmark protein [Hydrocarboniphaga sp.]MDB5968095.1 FimV N-terminal protein [Hydrocarboniphaga sp.]
MLQRLAKGTALLAGLFCTAAYSLGLGEIQVASHLNQALSATIPLTSLSQDEAEGLRVQLASPADFEKAGVERGDYLSSLKFSVIGSKVRISSDEIAREPFIALLVEARAGNSRVLRGYSVLLDLPPSGPNAPESGAAAPGRVYETAKAGSFAPADVPTTDDAVPTSDAAASAQQQQPRSYGPIRSGQTFWSVASKLRPDPSLVSMDQTMLALYTANPQAFIGGINGLLIGSVLRVPSVDEMRAVPEIEARRRVQALRTSSSAAVSGAAAAAPAKPAAVAEAPAVVAAETPIVPAAVPEAPAGTEAASPAPPGAVDAAAPTAAADAAPAETPVPAATPAPATPPAATPAPPAPPASYPLPWALVLLVLALLAVWVLWRRRRLPPAVPVRSDVPVAAAPLAAAATAIEPEVELAALPAGEPLVLVSPEAPPELPTEAAIASEAIIDLPQAEAEPMAEVSPIEGEDAHPADIDLATSITGAQPSLDELDPLAEADFHLSYGLYDEAVRGLLEASTNEPERNDLQMKLAETYFAAGRAADFEALALQIQPRVGPSEWGRLVFMGGQLCPDATLFRGETDAELIRAEHHGNGVEFRLEPMLEMPAPPETPAARNDNLLEFELSQFDASAPVDVSTWHTQTHWRGSSPSTSGAAPAALDLSDPGVVAFEALPDIDPSDIDLYEAEPEVEISTDDEVGTKLDLARAYLDMGDKQMARDLLAEVALQGNAAQQADAQSLLQRLPL